MDWYKSLRILSLKEVVSDDPSEDYFKRKVFRWYSTNFATPLNQVYDLPEGHIMQAYYEHSFEGMEPHELKEECRRLCMTEAEENRKKDFEDFDKLEDWRFEKEAEEESFNPKTVKTVEHGTLGQIQKKTPKSQTKKTINKAGDETSMPTGEGVLPDGAGISMSFVDLEELDRLDESDPLFGADDDLLGVE